MKLASAAAAVLLLLDSSTTFVAAADDSTHLRHLSPWNKKNGKKKKKQKCKAIDSRSVPIGEECCELADCDQSDKEPGFVISCEIPDKRFCTNNSFTSTDCSKECTGDEDCDDDELGNCSVSTTLTNTCTDGLKEPIGVCTQFEL